ncbi:MAG: hypothetical protein CMJ48_13890 [Planctomycetaceae bacterium]|nr:hypothetical protein [Planctomycetaceae bacterium]
MRRIGTFVAIVFASGFWAGPESSAANETHGGVWRTDFREAVSEAQRSGKPLLLHFHASWCGPCRKMERDVLYQPDVLKKLRAGFVPVMIDSDVHPELVKRFNINALPSDVFLDPSGRVVGRDSGYRDRGIYLSRAGRIQERFPVHVAGETTTLQKRDAGEKFTRQEEPRPSVARAETPRITANATMRTRVEHRGDSETQIAASVQPPALDGYSPVSLMQARKWMKGKPQFVARFQGRVFHLASDNELHEFQNDPGKYAPQLLGSDPVILWNTDRAVAGSTRYAAFFDGKLYLFVSTKSRIAFKKSPLKYARTQHVLRIDDVDQIRRR